ncbi:hypothetical protein AS889_12315 [Pseudomonas putida]|nr:hypothetical protein AS889_12315 [Pseudomonas putida]
MMMKIHTTITRLPVLLARVMNRSPALIKCTVRIIVQIDRLSSNALIGTPLALVRENSLGACPRWLSENSMRELENMNEFITDMNETNNTSFMATAAPPNPARLNSET